MVNCKVAVIGGGVLGCSIAYFLSSILPEGSVVLVERESGLAYHASSRNTGKVHAPFLYDPVKKKLFARAAYLGFEMWQKYAAEKRLPFKQDGVLEVATDELGVQRLHTYLRWGRANGLGEEDLQVLDGKEIKRMEPNVACSAALLCSRDASVEYGALTRSLGEDSSRFGARVLLGRRLIGITTVDSGLSLSFGEGERVSAEFLINAGGGSSLEVARWAGLGREFGALYFRGEYWKAPREYRTMTRHSIYSVPKHPEYPFLDPHWIVRENGSVEVGPNAVPVPGPDAYDWSRISRNLPGFLSELIGKGAFRVFMDREFLSLAGAEWRSALMKGVMVERVREFLPRVNPGRFTERGFSGIRSVIVDKWGRFLDDLLILRGDRSLHMLNYNSPGATGALPVAAGVVSMLVKEGIFPHISRSDRTLWDVDEVGAEMDMAAAA